MISRIVLTLLIAVSLMSCSSSNQVASTRIIQKRKHTSGFYFAGLARNKSHKKLENNLVSQPKPEKVLHKTEAVETSLSQQLFDESEIEQASEPQVQLVHVKQIAQEHVFVSEEANLKIAPSDVSGFTKNDFKQELKKRREVLNSNEDESAEAALTAFAFFASIVGWVLLVGTVVALVLGFWMIALAFLGISMALEAMAYFVGDSHSDARAGDIASRIASYYWYFLGTMITVSLGSFVFWF